MKILTQGYTNELTENRIRTVGQKGGERDRDHQAPKKKGKRSPKGKNKDDSLGFSSRISQTVNGDDVSTDVVHSSFTFISDS